jgi:hypothetical protein
MTKPMTFTAASIRRAIQGVRTSGERVTAVTIATDGSITVHTTDAASAAIAAEKAHDAEREKWKFA